MFGILTKGYLFALFAVIFFLPFALLYTSLEGFIFVLLCVLSFVIVASPILLKSKVEIDQPIIFVLITVLFGVTLRGPYFLFTEDQYVRDFFMLGESIDFFIFPTILLVMALGIMMFGYSFKLKPWNLSKYKVFRKTNWSERKLIIVAGMCIISSMYGIYLYFDLLKISIFELGVNNFSEARFFEIEGSDIKGSAGYVRLLGSLARPSFLITLAYILSKRKSIFSVVGILMILSLLISLALPILLSTRVQVIYIALSAALIWGTKRKISGATWTTLLLGIGLVFSILTGYRHNSVESYSDIRKNINVFSVIESVVDNRNLLGVSKTAHIINNVPSEFPHTYGSTMINWIIAPIPRSIWKEKPSILPGDIIRDKIYKLPSYTGRIPPGIIAELYLNFSYYGFLLLFFIGMFLKKIYVSFKSIFTQSDNAVVIYFLIVPSFVDLLFGAGLNYAILKLIQDFIPLFIILLFIRK